MTSKKSFTPTKLFALFFTASLSAAIFIGCSIDSGESSSRTVSINVQGFYTGDGGALVRNNSGASIRSMDLRQNGDGLEGVDNNGIIFKGTIGRVVDDSQQATFTLVGSTTAGNEGTMTGTITVNGTTASMQGTWSEPSLFSTVQGFATVVAAPTNTTGDVDNGNTNGNGGTTNTP